MTTNPNPRAVKDGEIIRRAFSNVVKAIDKEKRLVDFVISTETEDRMGDIIRVNGWELGNYRKNPVVLFGHMSRIPPIGKAIKVSKGDGALTATAEFMPEDISPFAYSIFRMYEEKYLRATSVGFIPKKYDMREDDKGRWIGYDFTKCELLEFSCVPIPANPECLVEARSKGIDVKPFKDFTEQLLDDWNNIEREVRDTYGVDRKMLETLRRKAAGEGAIITLTPEQTAELFRRNLDNIARQVAEREAANKTAEQEQPKMEFKKGFNKIKADEAEAFEAAVGDGDMHAFELPGDEEFKNYLILEDADIAAEMAGELKMASEDGGAVFVATPKKAAFDGKLLKEPSFKVEEVDGAAMLRLSGAKELVTYKLLFGGDDGSVLCELVSKEAIQPESKQTETETAEVEAGESETEKEAKTEEKVHLAPVDELIGTSGGEDEEVNLDHLLDVAERCLNDLEEALDKSDSLGHRPNKQLLRKFKFVGSYLRELADRVSGPEEAKAVKDKTVAEEKEDKKSIATIKMSELDAYLAEKVGPLLGPAVERAVNKIRGRLD